MHVLSLCQLKSKYKYECVVFIFHMCTLHGIIQFRKKVSGIWWKNVSLAHCFQCCARQNCLMYNIMHIFYLPWTKDHCKTHCLQVSPKGSSTLTSTKDSWDFTRCLFSLLSLNNRTCLSKQLCWRSRPLVETSQSRNSMYPPTFSGFSIVTCTVLPVL